MANGQHNRLATRRAAIRAMAAGTVGAIGCSAVKGVCAIRGPEDGSVAKPERRSATGAFRVDQQAAGSEVWQVTTGEFRQSNIYCEIPYCSSDGRYFVYERRNPSLPGRNNTEFMVVELRSWKQHRLDNGIGIQGSAISHEGTFYYLKQVDSGTAGIMQADLATGKSKMIGHLKGPESLTSLGTVSADARHYACGIRLDDKYTSFGILLVDLKRGDQVILDRDPFILNPHPQFEPGESKQVMIQHNRGGKYNPDGKLERLVGPEGATLYLLSVHDGKRTTLQVGRPFTTPITGHEAWIGKTKEILLTVAARGEYLPEKGNLLAVRADAPARLVAGGYRFNHVGVSRCGRFFCCDDWRGTCRLVIGSIKTGKTAVVCESGASMGRPQNTHPHAYLTPDLKWLIFNSDRRGFPHIHAAGVPESMIEELSGT